MHIIHKHAEEASMTRSQLEYELEQMQKLESSMRADLFQKGQQAQAQPAQQAQAQPAQQDQ